MSDFKLLQPGAECRCVVMNRQDKEPQREWLKRCMCMHHWMQTNYYRDKRKFELEKKNNESRKA